MKSLWKAHHEMRNIFQVEVIFSPLGKRDAYIKKDIKKHSILLQLNSKSPFYNSLELLFMIFGENSAGLSMQCGPLQQ